MSKTVKKSINLDELRTKGKRLIEESKTIDRPTGGLLSECGITLHGLLDEFSQNTTINSEYFVVITGAFNVTLDDLRNLLPQIERPDLRVLIAEIIAGVESIVQAFAK